MLRLVRAFSRCELSLLALRARANDAARTFTQTLHISFLLSFSMSLVSESQHPTLSTGFDRSAASFRFSISLCAR